MRIVSYLALRYSVHGPVVVAKRSRVALLIALTIIPLGYAAAQRGDYTTIQAPPQRQSTGNQGSGEATQTIIFTQPPPVFSACPWSGGGTPGESEHRAQVLDKEGPQLPQLYSMSTFSVMGFSKGNWPVVIDYLLEQDSLLLFIVAPEGQKPQIFRLDGKKGHWQTKVQLPGEIGSQLRVSQYLVQTLDNSVGSVSPSHVHIHGIAAGPQAVGSIGIDQVTFAPASIQLAQHQKAQYSFHSLFDFKNTEITFIRLAKSSDGEIIAAAVGEKSMGSILQNASKNGVWDGSTKLPDVVKSYPPPVQKWLSAPGGQHTLQVRAWYGAKEGGDWVTALSETVVTVE